MFDKLQNWIPDNQRIIFLSWFQSLLWISAFHLAPFLSHLFVIFIRRLVIDTLHNLFAALLVFRRRFVLLIRILIECHNFFLLVFGLLLFDIVSVNDWDFWLARFYLLLDLLVLHILVQLFLDDIPRFHRSCIFAFGALFIVIRIYMLIVIHSLHLWTRWLIFRIQIPRLWLEMLSRRWLPHLIDLFLLRFLRFLIVPDLFLISKILP